MCTWMDAEEQKRYWLDLYQAEAKGHRETLLRLVTLCDAIDSFSVAVNSPDWRADEEVLRIAAIERAEKELYRVRRELPDVEDPIPQSSTEDSCSGEVSAVENQFPPWAQQAVADQAFDDICDAFVSAQLKEPDALTDLERMAVYFFAGCEVEFVMSDDMSGFVMKTKRPCGLLKVGGKFQVAESRGRN